MAALEASLVICELFTMTALFIFPLTAYRGNLKRATAVLAV
jgi:hypothetical protein